MTNKNKLLTILSDAEQYALYGLPDFDDGQQSQYLSLSEAELTLASSRPSLHAQVYCILQIGYFKAKHAFFRFTWDDAKDDCAFVLIRYFNDQAFEQQAIAKHEHYTQRTLIAELFGYRLWLADFLPQLVQQSEQIVRRDVMPSFIAAKLVTWLNEHKIVRPGYTTLQELISKTLAIERQRFEEITNYKLKQEQHHDQHPTTSRITTPDLADRQRCPRRSRRLGFQAVCLGHSVLSLYQ